ncbi:hypothetical protein AGMMS50296_6060 [Alphaproteobacteria bacterium]|nr:hypothetical protein AGMMS50296_6060 [Alphaproteobacteria bacterium]
MSARKGVYRLEAFSEMIRLIKIGDPKVAAANLKQRSPYGDRA